MELLTQEVMGRLFDVTDSMELDREQLAVPLERCGVGSVSRGSGGRWEIELPVGEKALVAFLSTLPDQLRTAGYRATIHEEGADE